MRHGGKRVWVSQAVSRQLPFVVDFLGLRRNVVVLSLAIFCVGLGEELWARFLPKYLEALGASVLAIGAFGTLQDLLEGLYPYPGGVLADRWGRKRALVTFNLLALVGYGVYLVSPSWPFVFVGLGFAMAWSSLALPATFAIIGDSLPPDRRAMGFTVQSILKRVPTVLTPPIGGLLIGSLGLVAGVHVGLAITLVLGTLSLLAQHRFYVEAPVEARPAPIALRHTLRALPAALKRLLLAESIVRTGQGLGRDLCGPLRHQYSGADRHDVWHPGGITDGDLHSCVHSRREAGGPAWAHALCGAELYMLRPLSLAPS